jgi:DNA polymerase III sliding clamp (beta) subunit (PCNA family)
MKLNKKKLNRILPQIKAHLNVVVMMDNPEYPGLIDFLFQPKAKGTEFGYLNRLTCSMNGGDDLFSDTEIETLGNSLFVDVSKLRDALKGGEFDPELKDGVVNGINVQADMENLKIVSMKNIINANWEGIKNFNFSKDIKFIMPRIDYELMASMMPQFVSQDVTRIFMCGYAIDFGKGEDFINFVATDGRKLALCKFPCKHPKMGNDEGREGDFIFNPLHLFIPESAYSRTQWSINEHVSLIRIQTEDYSIDCWAKPIEGNFPNYIRVIPEREQNKEWMALNARSARNAFDSIKGLINNGKYSSVKNQVFFDAEDPKHIKLTVPGASVDIDGEASRPMCLRVNWDHINSAFFDIHFTKFFLQDVNKAILTEESRAVRGTMMTVTKIVMPMKHEDNTDKWGIAGSHQVETSSDDSSEGPYEDNSSIEYGDSLDGGD